MKELRVIHENDFREDYAYYQSKHPTTHTSIESIESELIEEEEHNAHTGMFGIQVSSDNEDRCYCFEHLTSTPNEVFYEYLGLGKA